MLAAVLLQLSSGFQAGDSWTTQRTLHYTATTAKLDFTQRETLKFSIQRADTDLTVVNSSSVDPDAASEKRDKLVLAFRPSGALVSSEPPIDPNSERINRMKWTAVERREGISWSRNWHASGTLLEAKVVVKPTTRTAKDRTVTVTYIENGKTIGSGTMKILSQAQVVSELELNFEGVELPGHSELGKLTVTDKLTDLSLKP